MSAKEINQIMCCCCCCCCCCFCYSSHFPRSLFKGCEGKKLWLLFLCSKLVSQLSQKLSSQAAGPSSFLTKYFAILEHKNPPIDELFWCSGTHLGRSQVLKRSVVFFSFLYIVVAWLPTCLFVPAAFPIEFSKHAVVGNKNTFITNWRKKEKVKSCWRFFLSCFPQLLNLCWFVCSFCAIMQPTVQRISVSTRSGLNRFITVIPFYLTSSGLL